MIHRLCSLIPTNGAQTEVNGRWVRAVPLPFQGGLLDRLSDAWAVLCGKCFAVHWPQHGELETTLHDHGEVIVPTLMTEQHVLHRAHQLGMHKRSRIVDECDECYREMFDRYMKVCKEIIAGTQYEGQFGAFALFMRELAYEVNPPRNWVLFHEHPTYILSEFLGIEHESPEFMVLLAKTNAVEGLYMVPELRHS